MREERAAVMTTPELLRREELIEQASLDALGLLDEFDAAHYARSFQAAPASVQEEIRQLQAAIVADGAMLSDEVPSAGLRGRVLGAVQDAMEAEAAELQPIASIGARAARPTQAAPERERTVASISRERKSAHERSLHRPLMVWRAASVALAASLVTAILWVVVTAEEAVHVSRLAQGRVTESEMQRLLGSAFPGIARNTNHMYFQLSGLGLVSRSAATITVNAETHEVFVIAYNLAINQEYSVRMTTKDGQAIELGRIVGADSITGAQLNSVSPELFEKATIEIRDLDGNRIMQSA